MAYNSLASIADGVGVGVGVGVGAGGGSGRAQAAATTRTTTTINRIITRDNLFILRPPFLYLFAIMTYSGFGVNNRSLTNTCLVSSSLEATTLMSPLSTS